MKDFEVLLLRGTNPSGVAMTRDILAAAAMFAARQGEAVPTWGLYSPFGGRVELQGGIGADTVRLPGRQRGSRSILLVPGIWVSDAAELHRRLDSEDCRRAIGQIAAHVARGGHVAASCSSVFLLHAAGVLDGRQATTTWWLAPELSRIAPGTRVALAPLLYDGMRRHEITAEVYRGTWENVGTPQQLAALNAAL
jgi:transcriptional regulator GlxA family with amidase domain